MTSEAVSIAEWLKCGWILELEASAGTHDSTKHIVVGGGRRTAAVPGAEGTVWTPDFFMNLESEQDETRAFGSEWVFRVDRKKLISDIEKFTRSQGFSAVRPLSKVAWRGPKREAFADGFTRLQKAFREEGVKKAVPVVFAEGLAATSNRDVWLAQRILAGLQSTENQKLRLYGKWSSQDSPSAGGFLGATPESLFKIEESGAESVLSSMAVAGTRVISSSTSDDVSGEVLSILRELESSQKDVYEHQLVASDIERVLSKISGTTVRRSKTRAQRFGSLAHLVTDFSTSLSKASVAGGLSGSELVTHCLQELHPTPALGVSPREKATAVLTELDGITAPGVSRKNFGAPFVVRFEKTIHALVSIRQMRWSYKNLDQIEIAVGSGCGVVPESDFEKEWRELSDKRAAVARIFKLSSEAPKAVAWSFEILNELLSVGVRRFVVCAGARNAPLVVALTAIAEKAKDASGVESEIKIESFFEERSAGFYALGISRALSLEPVSIVTTSGTAAAELLPAMAEADLSGVPLIAVTADRPHRLRGSGAPQSMPQQNLFQDFVEGAWDLEAGDRLRGMAELSFRRPLHLNLAFDEPLLADAENAIAENQNRISPRSSGRRRGGSSDLSLSMAAMGAILKQQRRFAIVGGLAPDERDVVREFLVSHQIACLLEAPSGLRGDPKLKSLEFSGAEPALESVSSVLRIGGVPTSRLWRDLDEPTANIETLSISRLRFSGMSRGGFIHLETIDDWSRFFSGFVLKNEVAREADAAWTRYNAEESRRLESALEKARNSEPAFVRELSKQIPENDLVYVGNSLPIRWWDLAATREKQHVVEANRGVNGIDGQISTALGLASVLGRDVWILIGDLTALYDLSAPWALSHISNLAKKQKVRIVILNNSGGRIFSRVLASAPGGAAAFENEHQLNFKNWAAMWSLDYRLVEKQEDLSPADSGKNHCVIEIKPQADQTELFWNEMSSAKSGST